MKNLKLILLLQALMLGTLPPLIADDDCCPDGSDPTYECEDGSIVCDASECPPCSTDNPEPSTGMECCGGVEFDPNDYCCKDDTDLIAVVVPQVTPQTPSGLSARVAADPGPTPATQVDRTITSITPAFPGALRGTREEHVTTVTFNSHAINNALRETRFVADGIAVTLGSCGADLDVTTSQEQDRNISVGIGAPIPNTPLQVSVSYTWATTLVTTQACEESGVDWELISYQVFKQEAKLTEGDYTADFTITEANEVVSYGRTGTSLISSTPIGQPTPGTLSSSANLNSPFGFDGATMCTTASAPCCMSDS